MARPHSRAGLVNQVMALAGPGRLPLVSVPRETPARAASGCPPPAVSLFSDVTPRPRPSTLTAPPSLPLPLSPPPAPGARDPLSLQSPGLAGLPPRPGPGCAPLRSPQLAFVIPAPFLASPPTPRQTAKHGARNRRHTWNTKRAPGRSLPRLCREESACVRASVCVQPVPRGRRL